MTAVCSEFLALTADCVRLEGLKVGTGAGLTFRSLSGASTGRLFGTYGGFGTFGALPPYSCGRKSLESKSNSFPRIHSPAVLNCESYHVTQYNFP